jgi:heme o synthase
MNRSAAQNWVQLTERSGFLGVCGALLVLAKPGIVAAVTLSGFTGMVLAARGLPEARSACACVASLLLMALGAALVNSVLDRRLDRRMERLAGRNAALQRIGAGPALATAALLSCAALAIASAQLNTGAVLLLAAASLSYGLCYTVLLKPYTHWAAVFGGLPGALPVLVGSTAVHSAPDSASLTLFLVMLIWQPPHFWLLALTHVKDYRAAGVPVLPLVRGESFSKACIVTCVLALIPVSLRLWYAGPCSQRYAACALMLGVCFLLACLQWLHNGRDCRTLFRGSIVYLLLLLAAIIVDLTL